MHFFGVDDRNRGYVTVAVRACNMADYHYQNSTDKPDNLTERAWRARMEAWDTLLGDEGTPARSGFSFELLDKHTAMEHLLLAYMEARRAERDAAGLPLRVLAAGDAKNTAWHYANTLVCECRTLDEEKEATVRFLATCRKYTGQARVKGGKYTKRRDVTAELVGA